MTLQQLADNLKEMEKDPNRPSIERMIEIAEEQKKRINKEIYQLKQQVKKIDHEVECLKLLLQPKLFNDGQHLSKNPIAGA